jgi:hypothetical protein
MDEQFWFTWDDKTEMYAICSEYRGGFFIYTPDEQVAEHITGMLNAAVKS